MISLSAWRNDSSVDSSSQSASSPPPSCWMVMKTSSTSAPLWSGGRFSPLSFATIWRDCWLRPTRPMQHNIIVVSTTHYSKNTYLRCGEPAFAPPSCSPPRYQSCPESASALRSWLRSRVACDVAWHAPWPPQSTVDDIKARCRWQSEEHG